MRSFLRGFPARLLLLVALALAVRWVAVFVHYQDLPLGLDDNFAYHTQAKLLVQEGGFYEPFVYRDSIEAGGPPELEPSAGHPPGYIVYLAGFALVGLDSPLANRLASGVAGAVAVAVIGLAGRAIGRWAGLASRVADRAGLLAAGGAALFPHLWVNDALILSESLYAGLFAAVILAAHWLWQAPSWRRAAVLGVAIAAATLTRSEGFLLLGLLVVPLVLVLRGQTWRRRAALGAVTGGAALLLMAPWMASNLSRFEKPAPPWLATGSGRVLAYGNCDQTYHGDFFGYWHVDCAPPEFGGDESEIDTIHREKAMEYIRDHLDRLPVVTLARVGRLWQIYRPDQGVNMDRLFERRGEWPVRAGQAATYVLMPAAVAGVVVLGRRRVTLVPLLAPVVLVTLTAATTFGITRYRVPGDVALVLLAGLGVAALTTRASPGAEPAAPTGSGASSARAGGPKTA